MRRIAVAVALAVTLGGCGGTDLTAPRIPAVAGNAQPGQNAQTVARVMIDWGHGRTSHTARPRFISPSAQSLSVSVNGGEPQIADAPVPKNGQTTTLTIDAPAGTDLFEFDLWDRDGATGNLLGTARVTRAIVADQANVVNAVLDGVCAQIALAPAAGQPLLETSYRAGTGPPGQPLYTFVGTSPETIGMTPLDADGNPILGTVPAIALAQAGTNLGGPAVVAISTSGNVATVRPTGEFPRGTTGTLVASSPQCSSTATVGFETSPAIYASYDSGVAAFDRSGNVLQLSPGAFSTPAHYLESPSGDSFFADIFDDPETGNVFVPQSVLLEFTPTGTPVVQTQGAFATTLRGPIHGAVDTSNGLVYVLYGGGSNGAVREIAAFDREGNSLPCDSTCPPTDPQQIRLQYDGVHKQVCVLTTFFILGNGVNCGAPAAATERYTIGASPTDFALGSGEIALAYEPVLEFTLSGLNVGPNTLPSSSYNGAVSASATEAVAFDNNDGDLYASQKPTSNSYPIFVYDRSGNLIDPLLKSAPFVEYHGLAVVTPGPSAVLVVPSILAFTASGQTQLLLVTDTNAAKVAERDTCSGVASVAGSPQGGVYDVTSSAAGTCVITLTDTLGALTQVTVGVTITHLTGQGTRRGS